MKEIGQRIIKNSLLIIFVLGLGGSNYPLKADVLTAAPSFFSTLHKISTMEIFKYIEKYNEEYQISNLGRVKSLKGITERILKPRLNGKGYHMVCLYNNNGGKNHLVHKLVAITFLNHTPCGKKIVIDHRDFNRTNNKASNLRLISFRENTNKKHLKSSSKYTGVSFYKINSKWRATIGINGQVKHIGYFTEELDASKAYELAVKAIP